MRLLLTDKTGHALVIGRHGCPPLIGVVRLERLCVQIGASDLVVLPRHRGYRFRLVRRRVARDRKGDDAAIAGIPIAPPVGGAGPPR